MLPEHEVSPSQTAGSSPTGPAGPTRPGRARAAALAAALVALAAGAGLVWQGQRRLPAAPAAPEAGPAAFGSSGAIVPGPSAGSHPQPALPVVGNPAPDFALEDLSGRTVRLSGLRGKPVLLNFWASWCGPCLKEMPELAAFHRRWRGRWEVVGVDVGEPRERVEAFVRQAGFGWTFLLDSSSRVSEAYLVVGLPTTYFIDAAGIVRARHLGPLTAELLEQYRQITEAAAPVGSRR